MPICGFAIRYSIEGPSPHGESDTLKVCATLIGRLNLDGDQWGAPLKPEGPEEGIDCVTSDGAQRLPIQVTRAVDKRLWSALGSSGSATEQLTVGNAADDLRKAIRRKESIPSRRRAGMVLALNAVDTPGHALSVVVKIFRQRYGTEIRALGFRAVWVVGPTAALTMRLDIDTA